MQKINLLLTSMGGSLAPSLINHLRSFSKFPLVVHGVNHGPAPASAQVLDSFTEVPLGSSPEYLSSILKIIREKEINIVLPLSDEEAFALCKVKYELKEEGCHILTSDHSTLQLIEDKVVCYKNLLSAGINVPAHTVISNEKDLKKAIKEFGFPNRTVIFKPSSGRGGRNFYVCPKKGENPNHWLGKGERESVLHNISLDDDFSSFFSGSTIVMPALSQPCYDVDLLSIKGKMLTGVIRKRINPAGIPFRGNYFVKDEAFLEICAEICKCLKLDSLHDLDFMTDENGKPALLEVNPRPSGSISASLKAGIPLIDYTIEALLLNKNEIYSSDPLVSQVIPYTELMTF